MQLKRRKEEGLLSVQWCERKEQTVKRGVLTDWVVIAATTFSCHVISATRGPNCGDKADAIPRPE